MRSQSANMWQLPKPSSILLISTLVLCIPTSALPSSSQSHGPSSNVITKDVLVIGGGAAGTFAAVRLSQQGKNVGLIERENRLGGQVNTYKDSKTGAAFDHGVMVYGNDSVSASYFNYLGAEMSGFDGKVKSTTYADFTTGKAVSPEVADNLTGDYIVGLTNWRKQLELYPWLTEQSGFHLPSTIPEELFTPFGEYATKYDLGGIMPLLGTTAANGDLLHTPTFYMMKWLNVAQSVLQGIQQKDSNTQSIYDSAFTKLGGAKNVFLNSNVRAITRRADSVEVCFSTPTGEQKISAKQLIMAIPPKLELLKFLDVSPQEQSLFGQFHTNYIYTVVVLNSGIPSTQSVPNFDPSNPFGIPSVPATSVFSPSDNIPNAAFAQYSSTFYQTEAQVRALILADLARVQKTFNFTAPAGTEVELHDFQSHSPYFFTVSEKAIKRGFYNKINALQGQRRTWWTSAAFESQDSAAIFNFTETEIVPRVLKA